MIIYAGLQSRRGHPRVRALESSRAAPASPQVASCRWPARKDRPCPRRSARWDMRGRTRHRFPQTNAELQRAYGDALPDVDTDRGATPRVAQVHYPDHGAPDRTESTDIPTFGPPDGAAG